VGFLCTCKCLSKNFPGSPVTRVHSCLYVPVPEPAEIIMQLSYRFYDNKMTRKPDAEPRTYPRTDPSPMAFPRQCITLGQCGVRPCCSYVPKYLHQLTCMPCCINSETSCFWSPSQNTSDMYHDCVCRRLVGCKVRKMEVFSASVLDLGYLGNPHA
jgi:hypothetical protein